MKEILRRLGALRPVLATLACLAVSASIHAQSVTSLTLNPVSVFGGKTTKGTVTLSAVAPSGGLKVSLLSNHSFAQVPTSIQVAAGSKTGAFTIQTSPVLTLSTATITAKGGGKSAAATLEVKVVKITALAFDPTQATGGTKLAGKVTFSSVPAPKLALKVVSSDPAVLADTFVVPTPAGSTLSILLRTVPVAKDTTCKVQLSGASACPTATIVVLAPRLSVTLTSTSVKGGQSLQGTITLDGPAPKGGLTVKITDDSPSVAPASISIAEGKTTAEFTLKTLAVASDTKSTVVFTAGAQSTKRSVTVLAPNAAISLAPATIQAGANSLGKITLDGPAPKGGLSVAISCDNALAKVPSQVTIPVDATAYTFTIPTTVYGSGVCTIAITLNGKKSTAKLTVQGRSGLAASPWPKFQGNARNTGQGKSGATGVIKWKAQPAGDSDLYTAAIGTDGSLYVVSDEGYLYKLSSTGDLVWSSKADGTLAGPTAVSADGVVYFGGWSGDNALHAVTVDGVKKWKFSAGRILSGATIGADGTVYFGSEDDHFYAVNPTGDKSWSYEAGRMYGNPAIGPDGTIYIGSEDNYLYAFTPTGQVRWRYKTGSVIRSSPVIAPDGTLWVGSWDSLVYAFDANKGEVKWSFKTGASIAWQSAALATDGTAYIASGDKNLYALDLKNQTSKWSFSSGKDIFGSPVVAADGTVYIGTEDGFLYALNPQDGKVKWKVNIGVSFSTPSIGANGVIYVGTADGHVIAIK